MSQKYYVYAHINKLNGKIYIGKTNNIKRRWQLANYANCTCLYRAFQKYGWNNFDHVVLVQCSLEEDAFEFEKQYIEYYDSTNNNKGYNIAIGGLGGNCGRPSWNKGTHGLMPTPWNKGIPMSEETKRKVSQTKKGQKYGPQSPEHSRHKAEAHKEAVLQYSLNGKFIKRWKSAVDIQNEMFISRKSISAAIHKQAMAKGYLWFKEEGFTDNLLVETVLKLNDSITHYSKETLDILKSMYKVKPGLFIDRPNDIVYFINKYC